MISRATLGFDGAFFCTGRAGFERLGRGSGVLAMIAAPGAGEVDEAVGIIARACSGVLRSIGSEEGVSEPKLCFSGVRKGDLKGLCSVFEASRRRRLACGVDILAAGVDWLIRAWRSVLKVEYGVD
jgi:hypothetical protein